MGIRFSCPNGHKLNVKTSQAGQRALCPACGAKIVIPDAPAPLVAEVTQSASDATPPAAIENAPKPAVTEAASPSIVIALDESISTKNKKEPIPPSLPPSPPPVPPPAAQTSAPHISQPVVAPSQPAVVELAPLPPDVQYQIRRERRRRNQVRFALALLVMVIVLGIALVWVLRRNAELTPAGQSPPEKIGDRVLPRSFAGVADCFALCTNPRS